MLKKIKSLLFHILLIIIRSSLIMCALLLLLVAAEAYLQRVIIPGWQAFISVVAVGGVGLLIAQQFLFVYIQRWQELSLSYRALEAEFKVCKSQIVALEERRKALSCRVEELTELNVLDCAAASSESFNDFIDTVARLARDHSGAHELAVFSADEDMPFPLACYHLTHETELCLTFNHMRRDYLPVNAETGQLDVVRLGVKALAVKNLGNELLVTGELACESHAAGKLRLTLLHCSTGTPPSRDIIRKMVAASLCTVKTDVQGISQALEKNSPVACNGKDGRMRLAMSLRHGDALLGAIRIGFSGDAAGFNLYELQKTMCATAARVARALRDEKIYEQAIKDGLTGLYNKRHMMATLEHYLRVASRNGNRLCLILSDIDHFKKVNDTWGHLTGDIILREVSAIMLGAVRSGDMACRYGGEELAVLLPQAGMEGTYNLAERLRKTIEERTFISDKGETLRVTSSFGVASLEPGMERVEDLISAADAALYEAKEGGRNRVVCARKDNRVHA